MSFIVYRVIVFVLCVIVAFHSLIDVCLLLIACLFFVLVVAYDCYCNHDSVCCFSNCLLYVYHCYCDWHCNSYDLVWLFSLFVVYCLLVVVLVIVTVTVVIVCFSICLLCTVFCLFGFCFWLYVSFFGLLSYLLLVVFIVCSL